MYDVFFLSYDEPLADRHWQLLRNSIPSARRVNGIPGIKAAHAHCAKLSRTKHFFVMDADNELISDKIFDYKIPEWDSEYVHLWFAKNPVNNLCYGWGGVKLFPKNIFADTSPRLDMTTSFPLKIIPEVGSITHFNISPYETWRSAFRECVKLTLANTEETSEWLSVWCSQAHGPYADWATKGASSGKKYATDNINDFESLNKINDYAWLKAAFELETKASDMV